MTTRIARVGPYALSAKPLGCGTTSVVKLGTHRDSGEQVAIKIISKEILLRSRNRGNVIEREIAVMKLLRHPNILKLIDVYESPDKLFLVQEYVSGGELFDLLCERGIPPPELALRLFGELLEGVHHCHSFQICHRDLKPENLLLTPAYSLKIADFGMAALMDQDLRKTSCGSPHYAAPEVVRGDEYDGKIADAWSCGVILYALFSARLPFDNPDMKQLLYLVKKGEFEMLPSIPRTIQDLVRKLLNVVPKDRYTINQARHHLALAPLYPSPPATGPSLLDMIASSTIDQGCPVDLEIVATLAALGCGSPARVLNALASTTPNLHIALYCFFQERKVEFLGEPGGAGSQARRSDSQPATVSDHKSLSMSDATQYTSQSKLNGGDDRDLGSAPGHGRHQTSSSRDTSPSTTTTTSSTTESNGSRHPPSLLDSIIEKNNRQLTKLRKTATKADDSFDSTSDFDPTTTDSDSDNDKIGNDSQNNEKKTKPTTTTTKKGTSAAADVATDEKERAAAAAAATGEETATTTTTSSSRSKTKSRSKSRGRNKTDALRSESPSAHRRRSTKLRVEAATSNSTEDATASLNPGGSPVVPLLAPKERSRHRSSSRKGRSESISAESSSVLLPDPVSASTSASTTSTRRTRSRSRSKKSPRRATLGEGEAPTITLVTAMLSASGTTLPILIGQPSPLSSSSSSLTGTTTTTTTKEESRQLRVVSTGSPSSSLSPSSSPSHSPSPSPSHSHSPPPSSSHSRKTPAALSPSSTLSSSNATTTKSKSPSKTGRKSDGELSSSLLALSSSLGTSRDSDGGPHRDKSPPSSSSGGGGGGGLKLLGRSPIRKRLQTTKRLYTSEPSTAPVSPPVKDSKDLQSEKELHSSAPLPPPALALSGSNHTQSLYNSHGQTNSQFLPLGHSMRDDPPAAREAEGAATSTKSNRARSGSFGRMFRLPRTKERRPASLALSGPADCDPTELDLTSCAHTVSRSQSPKGIRRKWFPSFRPSRR